MGGENSGKLSLFDKIVKVYMKGNANVNLEDVPFTEEEQNVITRYDYLDGLRRQHYPYIDTKQILSFYKKRFPEMSTRQFYYDLKNMEAIFGKTRSINKDYERALSIEFYERSATLAQARGDIQTSIKAKQMADVLKRLNEPDEISPEDMASTHVWNLVVQTEKGTASKLLSMNEIATLSSDVRKEILQSTDTMDTTPEMMEELLKETTDE